jgi:tripartite-type tricarboxylate transporter receptor subunit TctC
MRVLPDEPAEGMQSVAADTGVPMSVLNRACARLAAVAMCVAFSSAAAAIDWPRNEIIHLVVPYAAGSDTDVAGRIVARYLGDALDGSTIVVENRPGVGGLLGTRSFIKAPPDGYTLCVCAIGAVTIPSVVDKLYDPLTDLAPISRINNSPLVLIVSAAASAKSVLDIVAWSRSRPAGLNYGSSGLGGIMYNSAEIFRNRTGAQLTHVPFRGGPDAISALVSGQIDLVFAIMSSAMGPIAGGAVRPIAVTTAVRSPMLSEVPTMLEQGIKDYDIASWNGLFAPPGVPQPIIDKLSAIMLRMPQDAAVQKAMAVSGSTVAVSAPEQFRRELEAEAARWDSDLKGILRN